MGFNQYLDKLRIELKLRNYSQRTISAYSSCLDDFFISVPDYESFDIDKIKEYLVGKFEQKYAPQTVNLHLNAIKFFYKEILGLQEKINIKFAKKNKSLPVVLSKSEVNLLLDNIENPKHHLMICLAYGSGLRVSEVVNLKVKDIDLRELLVRVREAKGKKDRVTILPEKLANKINVFLLDRNPDEYLFMSERGGRLSTRTLQKVFERAARTIRLTKPATFHSLRHSFATHLLESGVSIRYVQELLGHANIQTTQIYTKVTNPAIKNIKSPL